MILHAHLFYASLSLHDLFLYEIVIRFRGKYEGKVKIVIF